MPGVYISFPFCAQKCSFCNFASGVFPRHLERDYIDALHQEIANCDWPWIPATVYVGGGTPSRLASADLRRILDAVPGKPWREATIEAAPGSLTAEGVQAWVDAGISRVSLGVQSFITRELVRTGRRHTADVVVRDLNLLRARGLTNVNIDLIAGLPGQTRESWDESLGWVERLAPPHVSVYLFEIDEDSRLGLEVLRGGAKHDAAALPSDDMTAEFYETAVARLASAGIERYEISNFARAGCESRHNLKYWLREPYLGFGADAHSFCAERRWGNVEDAAEYVSRWRSGQSIRGDMMPAMAHEERFFLGLRLMRGVQTRAGDWKRYGTALTRLLDERLLERDGDWIRLTSQGVLVSNEVFREFIA